MPGWHAFLADHPGPPDVEKMGCGKMEGVPAPDRRAKKIENAGEEPTCDPLREREGRSRPGNRHGAIRKRGDKVSSSECTTTATGHAGTHVHGPTCGHPAVPHGDHVDYLVDQANLLLKLYPSVAVRPPRSDLTGLGGIPRHGAPLIGLSSNKPDDPEFPGGRSLAEHLPRQNGMRLNPENSGFSHLLRMWFARRPPLRGLQVAQCP